MCDDVGVEMIYELLVSLHMNALQEKRPIPTGVFGRPITVTKVEFYFFLFNLLLV
jgi:hypothetical protein